MQEYRSIKLLEIFKLTVIIRIEFNSYGVVVSKWLQYFYKYITPIGVDNNYVVVKYV